MRMHTLALDLYSRDLEMHGLQAVYNDRIQHTQAKLWFCDVYANNMASHV